MRKPSSQTAIPKPGRIADLAVAAVFDAYPEPVRGRLMDLRRLILDTARATEGVGAVEETLKWGQPSYLTTESKSGSTIRIDQVKSGPGDYAIYFNCQTDLIETFRAEHGDALTFSGNRAILFRAGKRLPAAILRRCIARALTYHRSKTRRG